MAPIIFVSKFVSPILLVKLQASVFEGKRKEPQKVKQIIMNWGLVHHMTVSCFLFTYPINFILNLCLIVIFYLRFLDSFSKRKYAQENLFGWRFWIYILVKFFWNWFKKLFLRKKNKEVFCSVEQIRSLFFAHRTSYAINSFGVNLYGNFSTLSWHPISRRHNWS